MDVVSLRSAITEADTLRFVDAWLRWRGDRLVPARADMNLAEIVPNLDTLALFDVNGPDNIHFRLCGSRLRLNDLIEIEPTGRNYKDLTAPADWPARSRRFTAMSRHPCGGYMTLHLSGPDEQAGRLECLNLPIEAADPSAPYQLICCNTPAEKCFDFARPPRVRVLPAVSGFIYVDIGAGVPEPAVA